jgi:pimeloyl-ACP methyl ester carboxylesterase
MKRDLPVDAPPDTDEWLHLPDSRRLAWRVYGQPCGAPILFFHGFPGSRLQAALVHAQAAAAGVALIAFDRPGFGGSSQAPWARTVDSVIGDVSDLADHLGLARFGVLGVSCGGPYALASARLLPRRVSAVGLLASAGPMNRPEARAGQLPLLRLMFDLARVHTGLARPLLALDALMFRVNAERALAALAALLGAPDRALLQADASVREQFASSLADAYRQGTVGAAMELRRVARWNDDGLREVARPVHLFTSGQDRHVPPAMGRWMAATLPRAALHEHPHEGHLSIVVNAFGACVRELLRHV